MMLRDFIRKINSTEINTEWISKKLAIYFFFFRKTDFYDVLSRMVQDGISIQKSLEHMIAIETDMGRKKGSSAIFYVSSECLDAVNSGRKISSALESWAPFSETQIILSGELRGDISDALCQVIKNHNAKKEMFMSLLLVSAYPLLLLGLCLINMYMVYTKIIPALSSFAPREKWSFSMGLLNAVSSFFMEDGLFIIAALIIISFIIRFSVFRYTGKFRKYLDKVPPWSLYKTFQGVSFLFNMSAMIQIDVPVKEALYKLESNSRKNPWLHERIKEIRRYALLGQPFVRALKNSGYDFPSKSCINQLLLQSEGSDNASIMSRYADRWLVDAVKSVKKNGIWITLIVGGFVLSFIMCMVVAIYSVQDMIQ
ncbi:type II secretion system F family protein [Salmonella enterica]|nr:type II secretion system F family protein [Salmonella enterica]